MKKSGKPSSGSNSNQKSGGSAPGTSRIDTSSQSSDITAKRSSNANATTGQNQNQGQGIGYSNAKKSNSAAKIEEEIVMKGGKSDLLERNLNQMVDVLNNRLKDLSSAAALRIQLSNDDPKGDQRTESINAPRIGKELDEILPKHKDLSRFGHKDSSMLVSSDGVIIDPVKLVVKTKSSTEAAKRLEVRLDDTFGNVSSIREIIGKKSKGASSTRDEATRLMEQNKSETKRQLRLDLERELFSIMENHVSRSILEAIMVFKAPNMMTSSSDQDEVVWPIPIRWPKRDQRSDHLMNVDGEMNTDLLLRYAIERINLSSGVSLFRRLVRLALIQEYFIYLFWLVKIKLFRHANEEDKDEAWLLTRLALLYSQILTVIGQRAKEEHEKDFVYKYLPYILSNAVYFSFYFLCPGSRHLYTKGFRKTIYMQIVMIMFGIQLCPAAVKVAWMKLFPEDMHDEEINISSTSIEELKASVASGGNASNATSSRTGRGESIPVSIAFTSAKRALEKAEKISTSGITNHHHNMMLDTSLTTELSSASSLLSPTQIQIHDASSTGRGYKGMIASGDVDGDDMIIRTRQHIVEAAIHAANSALLQTSISRSSSSSTKRSPTAVKLVPMKIVNISSDISKQVTISSSNMIATSSMDDASDAAMSQSQSQYPSQSPIPMRRQHDKLTSQPTSDNMIYKKLGEENPLFRTNLLPIGERPRNYPLTVTHQVIDSINANNTSPLVSEYLRLTNTSHPHASTDMIVDDEQHRLSKISQPITQKLKRTVPVSWCRAGGADTYRRLTHSLSKDRIDELSSKSDEAQKIFQRETIHSIIQRARTKESIEEKYHKVLASGAQKISRFALDILKQHQKQKQASSSSSGHNQVIISHTSATSLHGSSSSTSVLKNNLMTNVALSEMKDLLNEPQMDEDLADIIASAQLDKDDLLDEFLELLH